MSVKKITFKKGDPGWKEKRLQFLTATDMSALFGFNQYSSPAKMWENKLKPSFTDNDYTRMGRIMEPAIANSVEEVMKVDVSFFAPNKHNTIYYSETVNIAATPDAFIQNEVGGISAILELKSTGLTKLRNWVDNPPLGYLVQLATQCYLIGVDTGYLAIMAVEYPTLPMAIFKFEGSPECYSLIEKEVARFRENALSGKSLRLNSSVHKEMARVLNKSTTLFITHGIEKIEFKTINWD